jgi:hypothetical protein
MKLTLSLLGLVALLTVTASASNGQSPPKVEKATPAILQAFQSHDIVMIGEPHGNKQEYEWLRSLVETPEFADRVDDIVMEFGNSLYQPIVDRYERGEDVPIEQVQGAWRDTVASVGPPSPVYESLYRAVREINLKRKAKHQLRILCGDPNIDWKQVKEATDILPYLKSREQSYARVVETEVIAKHHRALLVMGTFHLLRHFDLMPARKQLDIETQLRAAGANPYLIVFGTNTVGKPGELDHRFDSWPVPSIVPLADNWVGELPAIQAVTQGHGPTLPLKLKDAADALLFLGPPDSLETIQTPPSEFAGTPYGIELDRRMKLQMALEH